MTTKELSINIHSYIIIMGNSCHSYSMFMLILCEAMVRLLEKHLSHIYSYSVHSSVTKWQLLKFKGRSRDRFNYRGGSLKQWVWGYSPYRNYISVFNSLICLTIGNRNYISIVYGLRGGLQTPIIPWICP